MNRKDAVNLIKEITDEKCTNLTGHDILLMQSTGSIAEDFELHIKTSMDKSSFKCLETIVQHNGCLVKKHTGKSLLVIFSPKENYIPPDYEETGIM